MCVLIHKPAGVAVPDSLIHAAAVHNTDGWGVMGRAADDTLLIERHVAVDPGQIINWLAARRDSELAIHLRRRTFGAVSIDNTHPFEITPGVYLMHNGSFERPGNTSGGSDTWHLVHNILQPLARKHPGLLTEPAFSQLLDTLVSPDNRLALFDSANNVFQIANRRAGVEYAGLWISNLRWIDQTIFPLHPSLPLPIRQRLNVTRAA